jgi:MFS family permease
MLSRLINHVFGRYRHHHRISVDIYWSLWTVLSGLLAKSSLCALMANSHPRALGLRSSSNFILLVVAVGQFSDIFIYGMVIPILPFLLRDRLDYPPNKVQNNVALLLAAFSFASVLFAIPAGWLADWTTTRRLPYLLGLIALTASTLLFAFAQDMVLLLLSRLLQGLSAAVVYATGMAMVVDTVGSKNLGRTLGMVRVDL